MSALLIPVVWLVIADRPADVGKRPYGATGPVTEQESRQNSTHSVGGPLHRKPFMRWPLLPELAHSGCSPEPFLCVDGQQTES